MWSPSSHRFDTFPLILRSTLSMPTIATLSTGVSYRSRWREDILAQPEGLDCLEVIAEHYLDAPLERLAELDALRERYPILPHGIGLSFGTDAPLDEERLRKTAALVERVEAPWFSEHLAFT